MSVDAFLQVVERLPEACLLVSSGGLVLGANRRVARLGVDPDSLVGRPLADAAAQPPEALATYLRRCATTSEPIPGALVLRRGDGRAIHCRLDGGVLAPAREDAPAIVLLRLESKDAAVSQFLALNRRIDDLGRQILKRRKVEEDLREQKEWLRVTLSSIGDAVIATDVEGRVVFMNPVAESLCGWPGREAEGRPLNEVFRLVDESTRLPVESPVEKIAREGGVVGLANHTLLIAKGDAETPIDDSAAPIVDGRGEVSGVILVFRDVTEKRRIAELKDRLAAIVESSDDIIVSKDLDGVITSWNRGAEQTLGYTAEEVVGRHVSMLIPPEHNEDVEMILGRVRRGEKVDHYETRRRRKDGRIIDVSLSVSPIRDDEGRIIGAAKIGRDVTQQKRAEEERREADRRKDEFLAMLAHELRNPLSSISNAAQLFGLARAEGDRQWARDVVNRQVKHLARLIDDLLDASRISRGEISLRREPVDLASIIADAVESVRALLEERAHTLTLSIADGGLRLDADAVRLEQVLVNLLTNAAKYTETGGRISLSARREGDELVVVVRDSGIGIGPELLHRVFDLFVQGHRTSARSEGGLGVGLALVRRLVELHGGGATAASEGPGKGSEFTVRLPA